ncbi:hypothetical protein MJO28_016196, partial [Puccinia striiformis f. sp. tritici]
PTTIVPLYLKFWPKASNWPHRGQAGRGSRLKLISSVGCPGEASHSPGQLPRELGLLRGFPEISDSLGSNADQLKSSAAPGQFLREALTLRKRGRRAGVLRLAAKEFGLAGQLRLAGDLDMTPKEFINSFLEIKNSNLKLRRSYWSIPRGWPSTFALVDAIRGELLRTAEGSLQWSNYIRDQAIIILRSQNPISGIHPNGAYISSAAITPAIFDADSKDRHREKLTVQEMPFLYQMVFGMLSSALDVDHGDAEEPPTEAAAPQSGSIEALEEELMEREGFRYTRGKNGSTSRRRRYERIRPRDFFPDSATEDHYAAVWKSQLATVMNKYIAIDGQPISDVRPTIETSRWNGIIDECYQRYCSPEARRNTYEQCRVPKSSLKRNGKHRVYQSHKVTLSNNSLKLFRQMAVDSDILNQHNRTNHYRDLTIHDSLVEGVTCFQDIISHKDHTLSRLRSHIPVYNQRQEENVDDDALGSDESMENPEELDPPSSDCM